MKIIKPAALILTVMMIPHAAGAQWEGASSLKEAAKESAAKDSPGAYTPNAGFKLVKADMGELNLKIYSYVRYLNQMGLNDSYINHYGTTTVLDPRHDILLNKVNIQFWGWLLDPKFRYLFYVWTNNSAQGLGAQVVVAGNLTYSFSKHFTFAQEPDFIPGLGGDAVLHGDGELERISGCGTADVEREGADGFESAGLRGKDGCAWVYRG